MWALWTAFFVSGIAGLSYELTWVRYLTYVFGGTTPAVAATVAVFFGGTALGAALGGRWLSSRARPVRAYATLEACIGVVGLALPYAFEALDAVLAARPGAQSIAELLVASSVTLAIPTLLLGATFPAMVATIRGRVPTTSGTALLYGLNTLGAVAGCLLVSFWWLPDLGLRNAGRVLASLNLSVALLVTVAARMEWLPPASSTSSDGDRASDADDQANDATPSDARAPAPTPPLTLPRMLGLAAASGLAAIAIEVQWVRALSLSFPATVYVFALVLAAYLTGIGLGSAGIARLYRTKAPRPRDLWLAYVFTGLGCLVALNVLPRVGPWSLELLSGALPNWSAYVGWVGTISVLTMLPATVAMGAALPILVGLAAGRGPRVTSMAGRIYGLNTLGGVVGSLAGTFWLMPALGLSRSLALLGLAYLVLALLIPTGPSLRSGRRGLAALLLIGGLTVALDLQPEVNPLREVPNSELLVYDDAPSGTVAVYEHEDGTRSLRINNQYTLSTTAPQTVALQSRLGRIPVALHPSPRRSLLIGFATGATLAAMASTRAIEQLECVEIHDVVFSLAPYFVAANHEVWRDPSVRLVEGDGRRHLARPGPRYDLVVADLFVPRLPGVGSLYSVDHFAAVQRRLAEGGLFVVWLPLWQLGPQELGSIVRSFLHVFPGAEGWVGEHSDVRPILGLVSSPPSAGAVVELPASRTAGRVERARRALDAAQLGRVAEGAPLNTLDRPFVELAAPRSMMEAKISGRPLLQQTLERLGR